VNIRQVQTTNWGYPRGVHGRNGQTVIGIVLHVMEGSQAACDSWFANPAAEASSHYAISKAGQVTQYVAEEDSAWANGVRNKPTWALLPPDSVNANLVTISLEHEGHSGEPWTREMLAADVALIREIAARWGIPLDREHIIGHSEIDAVTRANCPGAGLPWDRLMRELQGGTMTSLADTWQRPANDTGVGWHGSAWHGDTRYAKNSQGIAAQLDADIRLAQSMHMTRHKELVQGASALQLAILRAWTAAGFTCGIRRYAHVNDGFAVTPLAELVAYHEAGAVFAEGCINEIDNEVRADGVKAEVKALSKAQLIDICCRHWRDHADNCARAGLIPLSPAFEGDRLEDWVLPMVQRMIDKGWLDAVLGSWFAIHARTGKYYGQDRDQSIPAGVTFPPEKDPTEPGDRTGFAFRSYERWQTKLGALIGKAAGIANYRIKMQSTETGIEPSECRDDLQLHAELNGRQAMMPWASHGVDCLYYWIGVPGGMGNRSAWVDNQAFANPLPVIARFQSLAIPVLTAETPPVVVEPPVEPPVVVPADEARKEADEKMKLYPWGKKYCYRHGMIPWGDEIPFDAGGVHFAQPAFRLDGKTALVVFQKDHYTDAETSVLDWTP
jgi:hypothetical protein